MLSCGEGLEGGSWVVPGVLTIPACPGQQRGTALRHRYGHSDGPQAKDILRAAQVEHGVCSGGCSAPQVRAERGIRDVGVGGMPSTLALSTGLALGEVCYPLQGAQKAFKSLLPELPAWH